MNDNVELQATCAALGYLDGDKYFKEPDCLETIKDLIRFLKRDDDSCAIRRQLGEIEILQKDLVPIIKQHHGDRILLDTVIRLMANLTQPAKLCFQNQVPEDKTSRNYFLQIELHLQSYKEAFADEKLFAVFSKKLGDLLRLDWEHRQEEDRLLIERILIVLRNILHIPPNVNKELRTDDDVSIHDQVLWALHVSGMEDLLLYLASSEDERQFVFHVLEIISLIFREQTVEQLAGTGSGRAETEKELDRRELEMALAQETLRRKMNILKYSSRHSNFGGTFVVTNVKSISDKSLVYHRGLSHDIQFDVNKVPRKRPKNRKPIIEGDVTRRSTLSIRTFLRDFCVQFLENCYNPLMHSIKDALMRSRAQDNDETYYLWAMRFFMEFNRRFNFRVEVVSETMSVGVFHYIQTNLQNYHEMILCNRKEGIVWSRRMHLALKAYYELLLNITAIDSSPDALIRDSSKVIKSNVFYMMEYRDIFLLLLRKFDETKQSRSFLRDLIETTHVFLRMLEQHSKQNSHFVVQKKKRRGGKRRRKKNQTDPAARTERTQEELDAVWDEVSGELSAVLQGRGEIPGGVVPFDAASETDMEQQRVDAVFRIQDFLREKKPGEAVALIRSAREVWPERPEFGLPQISAEDEFLALREIFFTRLPDHARTSVAPVEEDEGSSAEDEMNEEEREVQLTTVEQEFSFKDFVLKFASPLVIRCYVILLADFRSNSSTTNHSIIKMLHRIAYDFHLIGILFQARIFRIFNNLLTDPLCNTPHFEELRNFARHILRRFFELAQSNKKLFVELFFWKNTKEAIEITDGYGAAEREAKTKQVWREEEDDELRQLFHQFKGNLLGGKDVVDDIMANMIVQTKTRRQVLHRLVFLDLISSAKDLKVHKSRSNQPTSRVWREEEELELRQLFGEYREADDLLGEIIAHLTVARSKAKVIEKILELGLVSERKELRKKRRRGERKEKGKRKTKKSSDKESSDENDSNDDDNDDDNDDYASENDVGELVEGAERNYQPLTSFSERTDASPPSDESENETGSSVEPLYVVKIQRQVKKVLENGLKVAVDWLKNGLNRTADDRDDDDDYRPVPIVPITEEQEEAMDTLLFRKLLEKCGIKPPANEQERFWRIPGNFTPADLRRRSAALTDPPLDQPVPHNQGHRRQDALRVLLQKRKAFSRDREDSLTAGGEEEDGQKDEEEEEDGGQWSSGAELKRRSVKRLLRSLSDDSSDAERLVINEEGDDKLHPVAKKRRQLPESSDEELDMVQEAQPRPGSEVTADRANDEPHNQDLVNGLDSFPATVLSQPMSDSDLDDHRPLASKKKKTVIQSDSDDNE